MEQDNFEEQADGSLHITSRNLLLRLKNPPAWIRGNPRAPHLINELTRSGFFREEVRRTKIKKQKDKVMKKWRMIEYPLVIGMFIGILYHYHYYCKDIERVYYISNKL
ncbi:hypothetical protein BD770DRAFT_411580 [Pilaira anomala]|nr:hypothetical protein BD770DRAFT_411580 [Pilaira anomala]